MFHKFFELFSALNNEALENQNRDITCIRDAQSELLNAWTDYMMCRDEPPTREEIHMYGVCYDIVSKF